MNFGKGTDMSETSVRKLYTGVENFKVVAVNPSLAELQTLYGENSKEESYFIKRDEGKSDLLKLVFHLNNNVENEDKPTIKTRLTLLLSNENLVSGTGKKQVINVFGQTAWLTEEQLKNITPTIDIGGQGTYFYDTTGIRLSYKGEETLISLLKTLLGINNPKEGQTPDEKELCKAQFSKEDMQELFKGNVKSLNNLISSTQNKVGILLGVKQVESSFYQDTYSNYVLRQFVKHSNKADKYEYLLKNLRTSQENGAYSMTDFGNTDFVLREFNPSQANNTVESLTPSVTEVEDLFK